MEKIIRLSKEKSIEGCQLNPEKPFLRVVKLILHKEDLEHPLDTYPNLILKKIYNKGNSIEKESIYLMELFDKKDLTPEFEKEILFNDDKIESIEFSVDENFPNKAKLNILCETIDTTIPFYEAFEEFQNHLNIRSNTKILFSAPFGQGKTTFLKKFFYENRNKYEAFHLFPVNYSIAQNEDIFKYIKCELLFQLLEKDVEFDKEKFTHFDTFSKFVKKNIHHFLSPFIRLLPATGNSLYKIYEKLYDLSVNYFDYHDESEIDDEKKALNFITDLVEQEGSLYEDNFYTQLIRQLVCQIKEKGKQPVLIIDDTDRMDPEHIFRILNVFAAHFDTPEYSPEPNKFGFDKIIIVCDYLNLKKIFSYKYGVDTDYKGFIDKYFSREIFYFNNTKIISKLIDKFPTLNSEVYEDENKILRIVLKDLININLMSLRELLKFSQNDYSFIFQNYLKDSNKISPSFLLSIRILNHLFGFETLVELLKKCKELVSDKKANKDFYVEYSILGLLPLKNLSVKGITLADGNTIQTTLNGKNVKFTIIHDKNNREFFADMNSVEDKNFFPKDFYELLIELTQKYREQGYLN